MQSAQTLRTVPKEFLKPPGGINPNVLMFTVALLLIFLSAWGYFWRSSSSLVLFYG